MAFPIQIGDDDPSSQLTLDAYDNAGTERFVYITQPITDASVSVGYQHIDALIAALTILKRGFDHGWDE